jgi:hypothetical protein
MEKYIGKNNNSVFRFFFLAEKGKKYCKDFCQASP